jgi:hypothetical protein
VRFGICFVTGLSVSDVISGHDSGVIAGDRRSFGRGFVGGDFTASGHDS